MTCYYSQLMRRATFTALPLLCIGASATLPKDAVFLKCDGLSNEFDWNSVAHTTNLVNGVFDHYFIRRAGTKKYSTFKAFSISDQSLYYWNDDRAEFVPYEGCSVTDTLISCEQGNKSYGNDNLPLYNYIKVDIERRTGRYSNDDLDADGTNSTETFSFAQCAITSDPTPAKNAF